MVDFKLVQSRDLNEELLELCPEFEPALRAYQNEFRGKMEITDLFPFVRFLVASVEQGHTDRFPKIFEYFEGLLRIPNMEHAYNEIVRVELLKTLRAECLASKVDLESFAKYFGPRTLSIWSIIGTT